MMRGIKHTLSAPASRSAFEAGEAPVPASWPDETRNHVIELETGAFMSNGERREGRKEGGKEGFKEEGKKRKGQVIVG